MAKSWRVMYGPQRCFHFPVESASRGLLEVHLFLRLPDTLASLSLRTAVFTDNVFLPPPLLPPKNLVPWYVKMQMRALTPWERCIEVKRKSTFIGTKHYCDLALNCSWESRLPMAKRKFFKLYTEFFKILFAWFFFNQTSP